MTAAKPSRYEPDAYMLGETARCSLTLLHAGGPVTVYRLGQPHTGIGATRLVFIADPHVEQIILTGDRHPGDGHGLVSCAGYGLSWWVSRLSPGYLCEKFLRQQYVRAFAIEAIEDDLREHLEEPDDEHGKTSGRALKMRDALQEAKESEDGWVADPFRSAESFTDLYCDIWGECPYDLGYGYDPTAAGWLVAIQRRFAECYRSMIVAGAEVST
jgi:hypothetical protein